jgi:hypothetical protein
MEIAHDGARQDRRSRDAERLHAAQDDQQLDRRSECAADAGRDKGQERDLQHRPSADVI